MSEERERVEHPSWCDSERCTAPEFRPTNEEYKAKGERGEHVSRVLALSGYTPIRGLELSVFLSQSVAPWGTGTYLRFEGENSDGRSSWTTEAGESGIGFLLYELLGQEVKDSVREFPILYAERFPYVQHAIEDESDEATAAAVMPRDPVELEERLTAEQVEDEDEGPLTALCVSLASEGGEGYRLRVMRDDGASLFRQNYAWESFPPASAGHRLIEHGFMIRPDARGPERVNGWRRVPVDGEAWSVPVIRTDETTGSANEVPETQDVGGSMPSYRVTVNAKELTEGTLQEAKAAVADLVTRRLGAEPERLAGEAQTLNRAFSAGAVEADVEERGQWFTVFDAYGEDPLRILLTKEG